MNRRPLALAIAALSFAALLLGHESAAEQQQRRADPPPAQKRSADQQPSGDAVSPRAGEKKTPADAPNAPKSAGDSGSFGPAGAVKTLRLPEFGPDLPDAPGRETVTVLCSACHSTRYITNQPPLPRETWVAEVTKMQKTYGAPVPDDKVGEIVDYLVAVRGPSTKR